MTSLTKFYFSILIITLSPFINASCATPGSPGCNVNGGALTIEQTTFPNLTSYSSKEGNENLLLKNSKLQHFTPVIVPNRLTFFWDILNIGADNETLRGAFEFKSIGFDIDTPSWVGVGFGNSMRTTDFVICHQLAENHNKIHEHKSNGNYEPPPKFKGDWIIKPVSAIFYSNLSEESVFYCEFERPTRPNDFSNPNGAHANIDVQGVQMLLFAFNPASGINVRDEPFTYHSPDHHFNYQANLAGGSLIRVSGQSFENKQVHGIGMSAIWLLLFPFGIFYGRYLKSTSGWILLHAILQTLGTISVIAFLFAIIPEVSNFKASSPHAVIGVILISGILLQLTFGIINALVYFGLNILYPFISPRELSAWYIFFIVIGFWGLLFIATEMFFRISIYRSKKSETIYGGSDFKSVAEKFRNNDKGDFSNVESNQTAIEKIISGQQINKDGFKERSADFKFFTWETLNKEITDSNKIYVVANGKYVYDCSKWINSHPGGQIILYQVAGTDITTDYFFEAGFDAEEFTPKFFKPRLPGGKLTRRNTNTPSICSGQSGHLEPSLFIEAAKNAEILTEMEWNTIVKARRTHIHTKLAIEKLASLLIGELQADTGGNSRMTLDTRSPKEFDRFEYRRYGLIQKRVSSDPTSKNLILNLKFCDLYPFLVKENEPVKFKAGECIEIQIRINGSWVSRYYTPMGTLKCFEINIKIYPNGLVGNFFIKQKLGDRQFKVRGPFGDTLFDPSKQISNRTNDWLPDKLFMITAGSGFTVSLQVIHILLLPTLEPIRVFANFMKTNADELNVMAGDTILIKSHTFDGWAYAVNFSTRQEGYIPLTCTYKTRTKIYVINCVQDSKDIFGLQILDGAQIAYSNNIQVNHIINDGSEISPREHLSGYIRQGKFDQSMFNEIVGEVWVSSGSNLAVVVGPDSFNSNVVDYLTEIGAANSEIRIMPSRTYIEYF
ncbi:hypothetical protein HK099_005430 [Clydaea vesicula]|uniref:Cytochrome b5 heme-binding domain-containing protein n=1 Tax=Clydaea vesicula TaxID=447962 RepID=A0AAD5U1M0_9FUNG|nr:hypothetical protein HK099_005430 [Clydaea vesicula]